MAEQGRSLDGGNAMSWTGKGPGNWNTNWNAGAWGQQTANPGASSGPGAPAWDRTRVYRDPARGWIAGVCAGIADHIELEPMLVRLVAVLCLIFFFIPTMVAYVAFALVLKPKPPALFASADEESFFRGLRSDPGSTLRGIRERFGRLERRLARAEALVTSDEFDLRRRFRDLDR
jgi:phage shock protein C